MSWKYIWWIFISGRSWYTGYLENLRKFSNSLIFQHKIIFFNQSLKKLQNSKNSNAFYKKCVSASKTLNHKKKIVFVISKQNCFHVFPQFHVIVDQKFPFLLIKSLNFQFYAHNFCHPEPSKKNLQKVITQGTHLILVKINFPHISPFWFKLVLKFSKLQFFTHW